MQFLITFYLKVNRKRIILVTYLLERDIWGDDIT